MTQILKMVLSMSLSGALLILLFLLGIRLIKGRLGRQWQYYIWLIVVMRLLLPFGPEESLMKRAYTAADRVIVQMTQTTRQMSRNGQEAEQSTEQDTSQSANKDFEHSDTQNFEQQSQHFVEESVETIPSDSYSLVPNSADRDINLKERHIFTAARAFAGQYLWVVWLTAALCILMRKITLYQSYIKHVKAGAEPVSDILLLDQLAKMTKQAGIGKVVELCVNPLVFSPMLIGYFRPCVVLPQADVAKEDFQWIVMHELTHYKRHDMLYKWLVQVTVCLHWFNPFVYLMSREIERACEFSCDEAVVAKMGCDRAADYGKTLLDAMRLTGTTREPLAAVSMSADKELLKERLGAIMLYKKKTKATGMIAAGLTIGAILGSALIGVYPAAAAEIDNTKNAALSDKTVTSEAEGKDSEKAWTAQKKPEIRNETAWEKVEQAYSAQSLPAFHIAFYELDEGEQEIWLDRIYADGAVSFFSVGIWALDGDSPLIASFAERFYEDSNTAFFSSLAKLMDEETLEGWLDRAMADQKLSFQSMLYHELDRDEEMDELEKELEEEQRKAYQAVGVTWNGKNCYYKGELVHIFLDIHTPNQVFYTLDMNPAGTVDIRIVRTQEGQITGVAYMSKEEVEELFGDMYDDTQEQQKEEAEFPQEMVVTMPVCNIREGAGEEFKVVGMIGEGKRVTALGKEKGSDGKLWYLLEQESLPEPPDPLVKTCYIRGDLLESGKTH